MTCQTQTLVASISFPLASCLLLLPCCWCCYKCRRPRKGVYRNPEVADFTPKWEVRGDPFAVAVKAAEAKAEKFAHLEAVEFEKVHIVWENDENQVKKLLADDGVDMGDVGEDGFGDAVPDLESALSRPGRAMFLDRHYAAFAEGSKVEYYSARHKMWLSGTVKAVRMSDADLVRGDNAFYEATADDMSYDVSLTVGRQLRRNVSLAEIRKPFEVGDTVDVAYDEVSASGTATTWRPAVVGDASYLSAQGYVVVPLVENSASPDRVQPLRVNASRVRARFAVGQVIDVHRGLQRGWLPAVVLAATAPEDLEPEVQDSVAEPSTLALRDAGADEEVRPSAGVDVSLDSVSIRTSPRAPRNAAAPRAPMHRQWHWVLVRHLQLEEVESAEEKFVNGSAAQAEAESASTDGAELVPSYRLRQRQRCRPRANLLV
eukprot:TRINITY_DN5046_c0_g1_i2.p1 TRINITY_DN5046_c0_g1~~TRINITY_DN5046_c0_g1_i2.p1  ORF type:complete len:431 (+),score=68.73 TRINITY_DN5046_c0_g1_i2:187-1479(+)